MVTKQVDKKIPEGIMILAGLCFVGALACFIYGSILFSYADNPDFILQIQTLYGANITSGVFATIGVVLLAFAVLIYSIGRGLLKAKNWARILLIAFSVASIIAVIFGFYKGTMLYSGIFNLIADILIIWYLLRKNISHFFK